MEWYLPVIWAALIGTAVAMYVILDGFDLGIGILFPFARNEAQRDQMMRTIAPFWDGNETWLVLGGGGLWVAFPTAYAVIMPAMYLPVIVMLLGLIFRGVAFEFRLVSESKRWWNRAFNIGSIVAAFSQGVILGGLIQGITVKDGQFAGGHFDWLTPFALLCGVSLVFGYAFLGATWLIMKADGEVGERARTQARLMLLIVLGFMAAVSLYTPIAFERIAQRWFSLPNFYFLWPVPLLTIFLAAMLWRWIERRREVASLRRVDRPVPARLSRAGDFELSVSGAADTHHLGHRCGAREPDLHADRHFVPVADHSGLRDFYLLAVPRQGEGRRELPLGHDPEKWHPAFGPDHAHSKAIAALRCVAGPCPSQCAAAPRGPAARARTPAALPARYSGTAP